MRDCISMCFDICTINIRVSIRVRGLHLVYCRLYASGHLHRGFLVASESDVRHSLPFKCLRVPSECFRAPSQKFSTGFCMLPGAFTEGFWWLQKATLGTRFRSNAFGRHPNASGRPPRVFYWLLHASGRFHRGFLVASESDVRH